MADGDNIENTAAEAAGNAAAAVVEQTAQIEAQADDAIARAQREADVARKESDRIAAAALSTELGAQINNVRERFETWQTQMEQRAQEQAEKMPALESRVTELQSGLALLLGALKPASQSASTPPNSENPTLEEPPLPPQANPDVAPAGPAQNPPPQAPSTSRRKHLL
jgi:hypothetical protein